MSRRARQRRESKEDMAMKKGTSRQNAIGSEDGGRDHELGNVVVFRSYKGHGNESPLEPPENKGDLPIF